MNAHQPADAPDKAAEKAALAAMATTGEASVAPVGEPWNPASPKAKIPPSEATSQ